MIRLAFADDHESIRKGIISMLQNDSFEFILEASDGQELLDALSVAVELPDICIVDIGMEPMDGFELVSALKQDYPDIRTLVLTGYDSEFSVLRMIRLGANGYITKACKPDQLSAAIQSIYEHGYFFSGVSSDHFYRSIKFQAMRSADLSEREIEFIKRCCTDAKYGEIAKAMEVTPRTLAGMRQRLFEKLNVTSRTALALLAVRSGMA
jgi:two-component system, NarL family, invasion response regulator UvrY